MSFLSPYLLFTLPLAALPFIISRLKNSNLKEINYPSLLWLNEDFKSRIKSRRLRRLLITLWRTFLIILIIYLLAGPVIGDVEAETEELWLIVDNSYSMLQTHAGESGIAIAKRRAAEIKQELEPEKTRLGISEPSPRWLGNFGRAETLDFQNLHPDGGSATLGEISAWLERQNPTAQTRIVFITDGQENIFDREILETALTIELDIPFPEAQNVTLRNAGVKEGSLFRKQEATFYWTTDPSGQSPIEIKLKNNEGEETSFTPPRGTDEYSYQISGSGQFRAKAQLADDSLKWDNNWYFIIPVTDQLTVYTAGHSPALQSLVYSLHNQIELTDNIKSADLILIGSSAFTDEQTQALQRTADSAIPRLVLLDRQFERDEFESVLGGLQFPWSIEGLVETTTPLSINISKDDWFTALTESDRRMLRRLSVTGYYRINSRQTTSTVLKTANEPLLAKSGNWHLLTVAPEPYLIPEQASAAWPVLLLQVAASAARREGPQDWEVNTRVNLPDNITYPLTIQNPAGEEITINSSNDRFIPDTSGFYKLTDRSGEVIYRAANKNRTEADLTRLPEKDWPAAAVPYHSEQKTVYALTPFLWLLLAAGLTIEFFFQP